MKGILVALCMLWAFTTQAQQYNSAVGVRGGLLNSITYKKTLNDFSAIEGIGSFRYGGLLLTGLYTIQNDFTAEGESFQWYYGGGAHIGLFNNRASFFNEGNSSSAVIGVDGVIGVEYTFSEIPLNLCLDYKPAINLIGYTGFWADHVSVGIRYVID